MNICQEALSRKDLNVANFEGIMENHFSSVTMKKFLGEEKLLMNERGEGVPGM